MDRGSYRQILRSTSIIGGASVVNILVGLLRIKLAAVLLGPAGVGLVGLLTSLVSTASAVTGLGFGNVGTRQIAMAAARNDAAALATARRAVFWGTLALAMLGTAVFWALRGVLAERVLGDAVLAGAVGWLALAVGLTVAAASQSALLNGMRRIADLAKVGVWSGVLTMLLGVAALLLWGSNGLTAFVLAGPLASFVLGHVYVARLPKVVAPRTPLAVLVRQFATLARLGTAFMVAGLTSTLGHLLVRTLVQRELGPDALGYFQAAATISMTYVGFVLGAMSTDYYPRLTAAVHDHAAVNRLVNEQTEVALLLASPVLLTLLGLAPWVIELLYAGSFRPAADVLRWQVLGDVLKVCSWPLGFVILAAGDGRTFMLTESLAAAVFVVLTWLLLPLQGLVATGQAFFGMYLICLPLVYGLARRRTGFRWGRRVFTQMSVLLLASVAVMLAAVWSQWAAAVLGLLCAVGLGVHGFGRLGEIANLGGSIGKAAGLSRRVMLKIGVKL